MSRPVVLIVEDDKGVAQGFEDALRDEFVVMVTSDPSAALVLVREQQPALILLDLGLPPTPTKPEGGLRLLKQLSQYAGSTKIIVCTDCGGREAAVRSISYGAYDVLQKPVDLNLLRCLAQRACWISSLERDRAALPPEPEEQSEEMIGTSESIARVFRAIRKVATTDVPVLITGESGTGKELTARAIHDRSLRKAGPFIPINCGAIPETLLESELFGYERGAFTGAVQQKKGKVEYAQGGTLFLDEVGETPLALQVKLLRFLQERTFERVGGRQPIEMNVRIMAATNVDLKKAIERGAFREDLYYRLSVVHIHLPPLRDRGEDVLLMAMAFMQQVSVQQRKRINGFTKEAIQAIQAYSWPGNVRELFNKIRRAVVMAEGTLITPEDLDLSCSRRRETLPTSLRAVRQRIEADLIAQAYTAHHGNISRVAGELGISRPTLYRLLRRYGLWARPTC